MKTKVVIVGGGPGGSSCALSLAKHGIESVIVEKDTFPRYHIGESMTGEAAAIMRQIGMEKEMKNSNFPVKHGVKVYGAGGKNDWFVPVMARDMDDNLIEQSTWQVRRSDFDKMLLEEAIARGVNQISGQAIKPLVDDDGSVCGVEVRLDNGSNMKIESDVLLDCSGRSTFLASSGITGPKYRGNYDRQIAIFSQVSNTIRDSGNTRDTAKDNTLIFYQEKFHWAWFIPLDEEVVSVGVVNPSAYYLEKRQSPKDFLIRELHELNPELKRRIPDVKLVEETRSVVNYSYQVRRFTGKGFICVGDAHRFTDPIFAFGLYATMKEAGLAAEAVKDYLNGVDRDQPNPFARHQLLCERGLDVFEDLIDAFWEHPLAFSFFLHNRYTEQVIDIFSGRVFQSEPSKVTIAMRNLLNRVRTEESADDISPPIGSRYHPERASLWETSLPPELEEWLEIHNSHDM